MRLKERLLSEENIFLAIYTVDSYIQNLDLLDRGDVVLLEELKDVFNYDIMMETVTSVKERLKSILDNDSEYFMTTVYFKPKKYKDGKNFFRPLHTARLIDQIAMTAMLQILVYEVNKKRELVPSELSRLIPSNFFGNRISYHGRELFKPWQTQYQQYTAQANSILYKAGKTQQYLYEVTLDLANFFPSVDPQMLFNYIMGKIPLAWKTDEVIPIILRKLLIFRLCDLNETERGWYLQSDSKNVPDCPYAKGLPQGLPHTYFFANLLMVKIAEEYERVFPGEGVFYVDDSVIFTNGKDNELDNDKFPALVRELNDHIQQAERDILQQGGEEIPPILPSDFCYEPESFGIRVHEPNLESGSDSKSYFAAISAAAMNNGERYLHGLCRETSNISFDIRTAFSDDEVEMLRSRVETISELVAETVAEVSEQVKESPQKRVYLAKLIRYKKFFSYRKNILQYRAEGNISKLKEQLLADIALYRQEKIEEFYEKYTDDILASAIQFVLKRCANENNSINKLEEAIVALSDSLYTGSTKHAYILTICRPYFDRTWTFRTVDSYHTLYQILQRQFHVRRLQYGTKKWEEFLGLKKKETSDLFAVLDLRWLYDWAKLISGNIEELTRMLLNGIFSVLFEFEVDDQFVFCKHSREPIQYSEVRILSALRNKDFSSESFWLKYSEYTEDACMCPVDYSLLQVLGAFKTFVCDPQRIDQLILIHKYCCDTWKNGSKYLHFYTLHNQEHAVTLIRLSIRWLHAVSFFKLKKIDYFVLFAACYLHDISMVTIPKPEQFYAEKDAEADEIFTAISDKFTSTKQPKATKKDLYKTYQCIDEFFERKVRGSHTADSANEIRKFDELLFLDSTMRETIARVSEAHGFDVEDVYLEKAAKAGELVNEKMVKILLRLSDLLDISRYRISNIVLNHNLTSLNETSRFHWISHLLTDQCHIDARYKLNSGSAAGAKMAKRIEEKLVLTVDVLMSQTTVTKPNMCKHISCAELKAKPGEKTEIVAQCEQEKQCDNNNCNFLCKWFMSKNNYLTAELAALKKYLMSIEENFFAVSVEIRIQAIENKRLSNETFDYLKQYLERDP